MRWGTIGAMPSELHLNPDRLRAHAAAAAELSEELRALLPGPDLAAAATVRTGVQRAVRELAELSAAMAGAAADVEDADREAATALRDAALRDPTLLEAALLDTARDTALRDVR